MMSSSHRVPGGGRGDRSRRAVRALVVGLGFLLTGCVSVGHEADAGELPGQWYSSEKTSIVLELGVDGTLLAKAWPENLGCPSKPDWTVDDLGDTNRLDVAGHWSPESRTGTTKISVRLDSLKCGFTAGFRRRSDETYICVYVVGKDPDSLAMDETLPFARSPELARDAGDVCLS